MDNSFLDSPGTITLISVFLSQKCTLREPGIQRQKKNQWWHKATHKTWEIKHLF